MSTRECECQDECPDRCRPGRRCANSECACYMLWTLEVDLFAGVRGLMNTGGDVQQDG